MIVVASLDTRALCSVSLMVPTPICSFPCVLLPSQQFCLSRKAETQRTQLSPCRDGEVPSLTPFGVRRGSRLLLFFPLLLVLICPATGYSLPKVVWEICFQFAQQHIHGEDLPNRVFEAQLLVTMAFWIPDGPHHAAKQIRPCLPLAGSLAVRFPRFS